MDSTVSGVYLFDDFELDAARRRLTRDGETVVLNQRAIELLIALVERGGDVVSKDELLERVWKGQFVEENNLTVQIAALRKALGDKKGENRFLLTVPGKGYQFVGTLKRDETSAIVIENRTIERITVDEIDDPSPPRRTWPIVVAALGILFVAVAVAVAGIYSFLFWNSKPVVRKSASSVKSVVVIKSSILSDEGELAEGIIEGVTYAIARLPDVRAISANNYFRYKDGKMEAKRIGREADVEAVITCNPRVEGDTVTVAVEMISVDDESVIWGNHFSRPKAQLSYLKDDVAHAVAGQLRPKSSVPSSRGTENSLAYTFYVMARFHWSRRSPDNLKSAAEYYLKALAEDPQYAAAYAGLAETYVLFSAYGVSPAKDSMPQAKAAALKALELDDSLAEAHTALGFYLNYYEWDRAGAEREFRRAIELNPNYATAHQWLGSACLVGVKRFDEALATLRRAEQVDPLSLAITKDVGYALIFAGRPDEAFPVFQKIAALDRDFAAGEGYLATASFAKGQYADGAAHLRKAVEQNNDQLARAYLAFALAKTGDGAGAKSIRDQLTAESRAQFVPDYALAVANLALGDRKSALAHLEKESDARGYWAGMFAVAPELDDLRSEPRFKALLKKMNLPE